MKWKVKTYHHLKRVIDVICAGLGLIPLAPFFLVIGLLIRLDSRGPVFFRQKRPGKDGTPFAVYKFRTMHVTEQHEWEAPPLEKRRALPEDHPLITRVGRWLRRLSLDELPQLINILRGEMSLVGPRPSLLWQAALYTPEQRRRMEVKPGITGWCQVNGRNALSWEEKIRLDVWYVDHCSFWLDLRILLKTPKAVLNQSDIYYRGPQNVWPVPSVERQDESSDSPVTVATSPRT